MNWHAEVFKFMIVPAELWVKFWAFVLGIEVDVVTKEVDD